MLPLRGLRFQRRAALKTLPGKSSEKPRRVYEEFLASEKERSRELQVNWGRPSQKGVLPRPTKSPRFFEASSTRVGPNQAIHDLLRRDRSGVTNLPKRGTSQEHEAFAPSTRNPCQIESTRDLAKKPG